MSYTLKLESGDLARDGSTLAVVHGLDKLKQELQLWVLERYGTDRFHPEMGSILQDMIGEPIGSLTLNRINNELARVMDNYQRVQFKALKENPQLYSLSELLWQIDDISASLSYDTVNAIVRVTSAASQSSTINVTQGL